MKQAPLVTIIMRSMGFLKLGLALESVAAQSYPNIEVIVVNATGEQHPPLPPISWKPGHTVRMVSNGQYLGLPQAGNLGLDSISGEFFCCLDDGGSTYEPHHVSALVDAAHKHPDALLLYARAKLLKPDNSVEKLLGRPFNRVLMYHVPVLLLPAALIRRQVIDLGCRFDESLELCEDRDFLVQIAMHANPVFLPDIPPTFNSRPDGCAPGSSQRSNISKSRLRYFENFLRAKWSGDRHYHTGRNALLYKRAFQLYRSGKLQQAREAFEEVIRLYPGNPEALCGLACLDLQTGHPESALHKILGAIDLNPGSAEYQYTAGLIYHRLGNAVEARKAAVNAMASPLFKSAASALLAQLPAPLSSTPSPTSSDMTPGIASRDAAKDDESQAVKLIIQQARHLLHRGEAEKAAAMLTQLRPEEIHAVTTARVAGEMCLNMHLLQPAYTLLKRAFELGDDHSQVLAVYDRCCYLMFRATSWQSNGQRFRALLDSLNASADLCHNTSHGRQVHVVSHLSGIGGTERQALNLFRHLSAHAQINLWTTEPALPLYTADFPVRLITENDAPSGGTLILVGTYFICGNWLERAAFERIVITYTLANAYSGLMARLIQIEENKAHPAVALTFPSRLFQQATGLPGRVEYPPVDVATFNPRTPRAAGANLVIGRHGRDQFTKFHPNDPAFFRTLMNYGHKVRILGGTLMAPAFAGDADLLPELLPVGTEHARDFLESLDVFIYRKHPVVFETGGTTILEAMAMELPVIVFSEQCGVAELIEHGKNGYLVDSEAEAIELVNRLSKDFALRRRIGRDARASIVELMRYQDKDIIEYYLGNPC